MSTVTLSMNIGPARVAPQVLHCMRTPPPALPDPWFLQQFADAIAALRIVLGARNGVMFLTPGTGTMALEMAAANFIPPSSSVAVLSTGYWGDRWATICRRLGYEVHVLSSDPGSEVAATILDRLLNEHACSAVLAVHADSSSGVRSDVAAIAAVAKRHGATVLIDGISAAGVERVDQTAWGVDAYLTSTPKGLAAPSGLAILSVAEDTAAALKARAWSPVSFSLDLQPWLPVMIAAEKAQYDYYQSPAGSLVIALAESLRLLLAEGVAQRVEYQATVARELREGLAELGISLFAADGAGANGVTVCLYPEPFGPELLAAVEELGVRLPSGIYGGFERKTFRIGHMGNVTREDVRQTLSALQQAMASLSAALRT